MFIGESTDLKEIVAFSHPKFLKNTAYTAGAYVGEKIESSNKQKLILYYKYIIL